MLLKYDDKWPRLSLFVQAISGQQSPLSHISSGQLMSSKEIIQVFRSLELFVLDFHFSFFISFFISFSFLYHQIASVPAKSLVLVKKKLIFFLRLLRLLLLRLLLLRMQQLLLYLFGYFSLIFIYFDYFSLLKRKSILGKIQI